MLFIFSFNASHGDIFFLFCESKQIPNLIEKIYQTWCVFMLCDFKTLVPYQFNYIKSFEYLKCCDMLYLLVIFFRMMCTYWKYINTINRGTRHMVSGISSIILQLGNHNKRGYLKRSVLLTLISLPVHLYAYIKCNVYVNISFFLNITNPNILQTSISKYLM